MAGASEDAALNRLICISLVLLDGHCGHSICHQSVFRCPAALPGPAGIRILSGLRQRGETSTGVRSDSNFFDTDFDTCPLEFRAAQGSARTGKDSSILFAGSVRRGREWCSILRQSLGGQFYFYSLHFNLPAADHEVGGSRE